MEGALTDIHIHAPPFSDDLPVAPKGAGGSAGRAGGAVVRASAARDLFLRYLMWKLSIPYNDPTPSVTYMAKLDGEIGKSRYVEKGVVFGLDGVYDSGGRLDERATRFMVTNDRVLALLEGRESLLFGASINPARSDAIDELDRLAALGARLVKVLPNSQGFDPAGKSFIPFYRKLAELGLPLLAHSGDEFALPVFDQSFGDPARLRTALDEGATVISAHGGSRGIFVFEKYLPTVTEMAASYERYYVDTSALTLPTRALALMRISRMEGPLREKLLFGTDYPIPCFTAPFMFALGWSRFLMVRAERNYFDRYLMVLRSLGLDFENPPLGKGGAGPGK